MTRLHYFVVLSLLSAPAAAMTGNDVLHQCPVALDIDKAGAPEDVLKAMHCVGYVAGLNDASRLHQGLFKHELYCMPEQGLESGQVVRIFLKWLEAHPEDLHETARGLFISAMRDAFPCPT